jgi:hypothetical protein
MPPGIGQQRGLNKTRNIRDLAKDNLTTEGIKNYLLLSKDSDGNSARYLVAKGNYIAVRVELYQLAQSENDPTITFPCRKKQHKNCVRAVVSNMHIRNSEILTLSTYNQWF